MWTRYPEIQNELEGIDAYIKKSIRSRNRLLASIGSELVESGGKRLRPAFVILASKFGKYNRKKVLPLAGAFEILHMATLIHDDVIDRSKLRRGKPTVSEQYGVDMAIYTGDFLFTKAVLLLSSGIAVDKLSIVARAIKAICEGEVDQYEERYNINVSVLSYLKRISRKTAVLFSSACALGAYIGKCSPDMSKKLARFGLYYGMAFQIRDDLNDFLSDSGKTGKPVGNDLIKGVLTLPVIYTFSANTEVMKYLSGILDKKHDLSSEEADILYRYVREAGGIEKAQNTLKKYIDRGLHMLDTLPDCPYKNIFKDLITELYINI